jgi:uncharacterized iron-regulated membrane protein
MSDVIEFKKQRADKLRIGRNFLVLMHRWAGLFLAVFLFISGLTGAIISWDHELDEWLNPQLFEARGQGTPLPPLIIAEKLEAADPRLLITWVPLAMEPGHNLGLGVRPRIDPKSGKAYELDFNQIALDPASGEIRGKRMWGEVSLSRENLLPFLYKLHYSMHIPDGFGVELGILFMGILAIVWAIDCFIALSISFPNASAWRRSFIFRWRQSGGKLNFDLHRSGGVWVWGFLLILSITAVSMNLNLQVMRPLVSLFSTLTPSPFAMREPNPPERPIEPKIDRRSIVQLASAEAERRGWSAPPGGIFYDPDFGIYGVTFYEPGHDHGDMGLGNPSLYFEGRDGSPAGDNVPGSGSTGDIFMQAQFPLHSGRILGLPGRIFISAMGLLVAMLSVTGIIIWQKKRWARMKILARIE